MNVGWIKLVDGENQVLYVMASHVAMIGPHYTEEKFAKLKQPSPSMCNIFIGGAFFTIQGSQGLVQTLVSKALSQVGTGDSIEVKPKAKIQYLTKNNEEN